MPRKRYKRLARHASANWPTYGIAYAVAVIALVLTLISFQRGWPDLAALGIVVILLAFTAAAIAFWSTNRLYGSGGLNPHVVLFELGQIAPTERCVVLDLGERTRAIELAAKMTTGRIIVVDIYSPLWTPGRPLSRLRSGMPAARSDPRLEWRASEISLLPLPDRSTRTVIACQILSEFPQLGDQQMLLGEIYRILKPGGSILMAERAQTPLNWLTMGVGAGSLPSAEGWRALLREAGFEVKLESDGGGIIHFLKGHRPSADTMRQLSFMLESA